MQFDQVYYGKYSGYAEIVPEKLICGKNKIWYIPHYPVYNKPNKLRVVYDCTAVAETKCLNDYLMKGPDVTNSLVAVLLRFRRWLVPIKAGIEAMFYQEHVFPPDRDVLRFFWWTEGNLDLESSIYKMLVHLFRAKSSPSCATFCLGETAKQFGKHIDADLVETAMKSFYVDDCLTGTNTEEAAIKMISDLRSLLAMGGFKLTKWLSSSSKVIQTIPEEERSKSLQNFMPSNGSRERVLGINWDVLPINFSSKWICQTLRQQSEESWQLPIHCMILWGLGHQLYF